MVASFLRLFGLTTFGSFFYDDFTIPRTLLDFITPSGDVGSIIFQLIWSAVADETSEDLLFPHDLTPRSPTP